MDVGEKKIVEEGKIFLKSIMDGLCYFFCHNVDCEDETEVNKLIWHSQATDLNLVKRLKEISESFRSFRWISLPQPSKHKMTKHFLRHLETKQTISRSTEADLEAHDCSVIQ